MISIERRILEGVVRASVAAPPAYTLGLTWAVALPNSPTGDLSMIFPLPLLVMSILVATPFIMPLAFVVALPLVLFAHRAKIVSPVPYGLIGSLVGLLFLPAMARVRGAGMTLNVNAPFVVHNALAAGAGFVAGLVYWHTVKPLRDRTSAGI